jgi:hypothetical protein
MEGQLKKNKRKAASLKQPSAKKTRAELDPIQPGDGCKEGVEQQAAAQLKEAAAEADEDGGEVAEEIGPQYTDKKENLIFLIYREIQSGAVAKSYMTNGLLIYDKMRR